MCSLLVWFQNKRVVLSMELPSSSRIACMDHFLKIPCMNYNKFGDLQITTDVEEYTCYMQSVQNGKTCNVAKIFMYNIIVHIKLVENKYLHGTCILKVYIFE